MPPITQAFDARQPVKIVAIVSSLLATAGLAVLVRFRAQINEATLAFVPKVLALCAALVLLGPFMMATLSGYTHTLFDRLIAIGGS